MARKAGWMQAALWAAGGVLVLGAGSAQAGTLVQVVTNNTVINVTNPADGTYTPIADGFFNAAFDPFMGTGLTSAVLNYSVTFTASAQAGPSVTGGTFSASFGGTTYLNGTAFGGTGNGGGSNGAPNTSFGTSFVTSPSPEPDLLTAANGALAPMLTGTDWLLFTWNGSPTVFQYITSGGLESFNATIAVQDTLTYTFDGDGALYVPTPEPASLALLVPALLGLGFVRRRRRGAPLGV